MRWCYEPHLKWDKTRRLVVAVAADQAGCGGGCGSSRRSGADGPARRAERGENRCYGLGARPRQEVRWHSSALYRATAECSKLISASVKSPVPHQSVGEPDAPPHQV